MRKFTEAGNTVQCQKRRQLKRASAGLLPPPSPLNSTSSPSTSYSKQASTSRHCPASSLWDRSLSSDRAEWWVILGETNFHLRPRASPLSVPSMTSEMPLDALSSNWPGFRRGVWKSYWIWTALWMGQSHGGMQPPLLLQRPWKMLGTAGEALGSGRACLGGHKARWSLLCVQDGQEAAQTNRTSWDDRKVLYLL